MSSRGGAPSAGVDEEFLTNLYRGGELLAAGKVIEAKDYLERAHALQPKNEKGQNLLGLTYFKLGLFDRAAEIYEALVRENPVDPTLRVNLGLVYLKTSALPRAVREFETAVDLSPEHKKAHNYLGLALAQLGNYAEAKDHFIEAGSDAMAQKMERALSGESTGLHRMPAPLEQQHDDRFAEIEGSEVVAEQGGQPVLERPPLPLGEGRREGASPRSPLPPGEGQGEGAFAETDWGAQAASAYEEDEQPVPPSDLPPELEVQVEESTPSGLPLQAGVSGVSAGDDDMRFAEDEGPGAYAEPPARSGRESFAVMTPEELGAQPEAESEAESEEEEEESPLAAAMDSLTLPQSDPPEAPLSPRERAGVRAPVAPEQWQTTPLSESRTAEVVGIPLADLAPTLEVLKLPPLAPFDARPEGVSITVAGEMLTRVDGLVFTSGEVTFAPELKRFRGRTTDQPFGLERTRMMRATGRAVLVVGVEKGAMFQAVDLADESAYFREDRVYAFEEPVMFENGRVPSEQTGDLDLVHLRGKGKVLLKLDGALRTQRVRMEEPVTVPLERLVGWFGNVSPRLTAVASEESGQVVHAGAELSGEGFVLVAVPLG